MNTARLCACSAGTVLATLLLVFAQLPGSGLFS